MGNETEIIDLDLESLQDIAEAFAQEHIEAFEFLDVAEDEDMDEVSEDDQRKIHQLVTTAKVTLSWPDA